MARAIADGRIKRAGRGRYVAPGFPDPFLTAARLSGVVSHLSAAEHWRLSPVVRPRTAHVTVPAHRRAVRPDGAAVHWSTVPRSEIQAGVTSAIRTVIDCARALPFAQGLAIADAALRNELVGPLELTAAAASLRGRGAGAVRRVALHADPRAASGLESVLRAVLLDAGLSFVPQLQITHGAFSARVDLGDRELLLVLEADSFEHHGYRSALVRDCHRYDELTSRGWTVLRFAWEQVMFEPEWVVEIVWRTVESLRTRRAA